MIQFNAGIHQFNALLIELQASGAVPTACLVMADGANAAR